MFNEDDGFFVDEDVVIFLMFGKYIVKIKLTRSSFVDVNEKFRATAAARCKIKLLNIVLK